MTKKEEKQFIKTIKDDVIKYLISNEVDLNDYKAINKALKNFPNKYYTEIKYKLHIDKNFVISIEVK